MRRWLIYLLPATSVAGFLCSYIFLITHYQVRLDDCFFDGLTHKIGWQATYGLCNELANGRWFSNLLASLIFSAAGHNFTVYALLLAVIAVCFALALALLFKQYARTFRRQEMGWPQALSWSTFFVACLYFLQYEGRAEVWGWLDSATVHLLSVTLCICLFALLIKEENWKQRFFILLVALCLGGMNEANAVCSLVIVAGLYFYRNAFKPARLSRISLLLAGGGLAVSLLINMQSAGYSMRMQTLPDFAPAQALKNTLHSFAMPLLHPHVLTWLVLAMLIVALFLNTYKNQGQTLPRKEKNTLLAGLAVISLHFYVNCLTLSDIVPPRSALWAYTLFLLLIFQQLSRKTTATSYR